MSILVAQAASPALDFEKLPPAVQIGATLVVLGGPFVSIAVAWLAGVFRRSSVRGPERLGADETSWPLVWIAILSIFLTATAAGLLFRVLVGFPNEPRAVL